MPNPESTTIKSEATLHKVKSKKKSRDKSDLGKNFVAPDGGWGWLVAIAAGVNFLVTYAPAQNFGLIYRERMKLLGITGSELTTIISLEIAMSTFSGLLNGPIFRRYTFRQVGLMGSFLVFLGLFLTIFAYTFIHYVLFYSIIYGIGRGIILSAGLLAVNTYFKLRRRTATAYYFAVAGIGPTCLPYLITFLMQFYGMQGTVLIFSGIVLHTFACSMIFQPVKWHIKKPTNKYNQETQQQDIAQKKVENICPTTGLQTYGNVSKHSLELAQKKQNEPLQEDNTNSSFYQKIISFFDLDLLLDISYINLAIGLTLVFFVEMNFSFLTPFILSDLGYENNQTAPAMSLLGLSDLTTRFLIPVITAKISCSNKTYFLCGVIGMSLGRIVITVMHNFYILLGAFLWMGFNKAFRIVFWALILPDYVPLKRLPAAMGLQMLMSSLFTIAVGPLIGLIRDKTSFAFALNFLNGLAFFAVFTWVLEALWRKYQRNLKTYHFDHSLDRNFQSISSFRVINVLLYNIVKEIKDI